MVSATRWRNCCNLSLEAGAALVGMARFSLKIFSSVVLDPLMYVAALMNS